MAFLIARHSRVPSHVSSGSSTTEDSFFDCRTPTTTTTVVEDPYFPQFWCDEESDLWYSNYAQEHNVWHQRLLADSAKTDALRFVQLPKDTSKDPKFSGTAVPPTYGFRLFVGQVKREITAFQLRYLLRAATGVTPRMVRAKEGHMCWLVVVDTEEDFVKLRAKNGCVLCDMTGAFIDESPQGEAMRSYCRALSRQAHSYGHSYVLPRNAIVIEQEDSRHHHHSKSPKPRYSA